MRHKININRVRRIIVREQYRALIQRNAIINGYKNSKFINQNLRLFLHAIYYSKKSYKFI